MQDGNQQGLKGSGKAGCRELCPRRLLLSLLKVEGVLGEASFLEKLRGADDPQEHDPGGRHPTSGQEPLCPTQPGLSEAAPGTGQAAGAAEAPGPARGGRREELCAGGVGAPCGASWTFGNGEGRLKTALPRDFLCRKEGT